MNINETIEAIKILETEANENWPCYCEGDVSSQEDMDANVKWGVVNNGVTEWTGTAPINYTELSAKLTEAQTVLQQKETEKQAKATAQASGNQKLLDLGLTQAEATALTGYTPPTEV